jgi:hypothetical protein
VLLFVVVVLSSVSSLSFDLLEAFASILSVLFVLASLFLSVASVSSSVAVVVPLKIAEIVAGLNRVDGLKNDSDSAHNSLASQIHLVISVVNHDNVIAISDAISLRTGATIVFNTFVNQVKALDNLCVQVSQFVTKVSVAH